MRVVFQILFEQFGLFLGEFRTVLNVILESPAAGGREQAE